MSSSNRSIAAISVLEPVGLIAQLQWLWVLDHRPGRAPRAYANAAPSRPDPEQAVRREDRSIDSASSRIAHDGPRPWRPCIRLQLPPMPIPARPTPLGRYFQFNHFTRPNHRIFAGVLQVFENGAQILVAQSSQVRSHALAHLRNLIPVNSSASPQRGNGQNNAAHRPHRGAH
jgi:hypothetical protein